MKCKYQTPTHHLRSVLIFALCFSFAGLDHSFGYTVTNISATYSNGQVFITWNNQASNLQYNVYRSTTKLTAQSQLTPDKLIGFVRDNSGKNIHMSMIQGQDIYYKIKDNSQPLASNRGLYVVTCTNNQSYYYAVTTVQLLTGIEAKKLTLDKNSLSTPVNEIVTKPQPVFQDSINVNGGEVKLRYVQFGNNQETPLYPALNSTGSYGFNFYLVKRGNATKYPLVVMVEGEPSSAEDGISLDDTFTNCYILGVDDWLPVPDGLGSIGQNARYCCYHEKFNIYSNLNPLPLNGVVKMYVQRRYIEAIHWAKSHLPLDTGRVYAKGTSQTGHAALLLAALIPREIAAVYAQIEPISLVTGGTPILEQMWGETSAKLNTDVFDPSTQQPLSFAKATDMRDMVHVNEKLDMPLIFDVHGKNDVTVAWAASKVEWLDSLESNHVGGVFYWDQRTHSGSGKNFTPEETEPDFFRYSTTKSYPAFSNCSIDQNPGNGSKTNGDPYGAFNGYLDWEDNISDSHCDYTVNIMLKDFYVGGVLDPEQYNTCTTDITFRRLQNFHPNNGATVTWKNYDNNNVAIQNGSISYNGGLLTIKNITVKKSGNRIELHIQNCQREEDVQHVISNAIYFARSANGYTAHADVNSDGEVMVSLYDLMGRTVWQKKVTLLSGTNTFEIPSPGSGIYLMELRGNLFSLAEKLLF